ncbi:TPA: hypothetical protein ACH3X3_001055 [Trebouxia sp. C0006]
MVRYIEEHRSQPSCTDGTCCLKELQAANRCIRVPERCTLPVQCGGALGKALLQGCRQRGVLLHKKSWALSACCTEGHRFGLDPSNESGSWSDKLPKFRTATTRKICLVIRNQTALHQLIPVLPPTTPWAVNCRHSPCWLKEPKPSNSS